AAGAAAAGACIDHRRAALFRGTIDSGILRVGHSIWLGRAEQRAMTIFVPVPLVNGTALPGRGLAFVRKIRISALFNTPGQSAGG
ncbi:MAG: hypothetical protein J0H80_22285, partial [Rhizobiales bacterium]|nr:hypothetical protein [Hyphomicrobiales bacterium]